jgi:hypothetical protein
MVSVGNGASKVVEVVRHSSGRVDRARVQVVRHLRV